MQTQSQEAFQGLLQTLQEADKSFIVPEKNLDRQGIVDGYRHLLHLFSYGIDFYLESDPYRPAFVPLATPVKKILGDNVDSIYYFTQVRGDQHYRIQGIRRDSCYLSFCIYGGVPDGSTSNRVVNTINHTQIKFDENGHFDIYLSPNPEGDQSFLIEGDSICLISREYFFDRENDLEGSFKIENIKEPPAPGPTSDEELAKGIQAITTFIKSTLMIVPLPVPLPLNQFSPPFPFSKNQKSWGLTDNIYCFAKFKIEADEVLEIHFQSPESVYWGIQTWNYMLQSMDYRYHKVGINMKEAKAQEDGSYIIYMTRHPQENLKNAFTSGGYAEGTLFCRWLLAESHPPQPQIKLKKISEL